MNGSHISGHRDLLSLNSRGREFSAVNAYRGKAALRAEVRSSMTGPISLSSVSLQPFLLAKIFQSRAALVTLATERDAAAAESPQTSASSFIPSISPFPVSPKIEVALLRVVSGLMFTSKTGARIYRPPLRKNPRLRRWSSVLCRATESAMCLNSASSSGIGFSHQSDKASATSA